MKIFCLNFIKKSTEKLVNQTKKFYLKKKKEKKKKRKKFVFIFKNYI
jgi:hypothetical protein